MACNLLVGMPRCIPNTYQAIVISFSSVRNNASVGVLDDVAIVCDIEMCHTLDSYIHVLLHDEIFQES